MIKKFEIAVGGPTFVAGASTLVRETGQCRRRRGTAAAPPIFLRRNAQSFRTARRRSIMLEIIAARPNAPHRNQRKRASREQHLQQHHRWHLAHARVAKPSDNSL